MAINIKSFVAGAATVAAAWWCNNHKDIVNEVKDFIKGLTRRGFDKLKESAGYPMNDVVPGDPTDNTATADTATTDTDNGTTEANAGN